MKGTVVEFVWSNPHVFVKVDKKDENGDIVRWDLEAQNPITETDLGWTKNTFKPGDEVELDVGPKKTADTWGVLVSRPASSSMANSSSRETSRRRISEMSTRVMSFLMALIVSLAFLPLLHAQGGAFEPTATSASKESGKNARRPAPHTSTKNWA